VCICCICCSCCICDVARMRCCVCISCVRVVYAILYTGWYIECCANIAYVVLGIDDVMYMMDMRCCVHTVLCTCWIFSAVYR